MVVLWVIFLVLILGLWGVLNYHRWRESSYFEHFLYFVSSLSLVLVVFSLYLFYLDRFFVLGMLLVFVVGVSFLFDFLARGCSWARYNLLLEKESEKGKEEGEE